MLSRSSFEFPHCRQHYRAASVNERYPRAAKAMIRVIFRPFEACLPRCAPMLSGEDLSDGMSGKALETADA